MYKILLILTLTLTGCSAMTGAALDYVNPLKSPEGIELTAQVGKENSKTGVGVTTDGRRDVNTDEVAGDVNVTHTTTQNIPWWFAVIAAVCGILVNPFNIKRLLFSKELQ